MKHKTLAFLSINSFNIVLYKDAQIQENENLLEKLSESKKN